MISPPSPHSLAKRLQRLPCYLPSPLLHEVARLSHFHRRRAIPNLLAKVFHCRRPQHGVFHSHGHERLSIPLSLPPLPSAPRESRSFGIGIVRDDLLKSPHPGLVPHIRKRRRVCCAFPWRQYLAGPRHHFVDIQVRIRGRKSAPSQKPRTQRNISG